MTGSGLIAILCELSLVPQLISGLWKKSGHVTEPIFRLLAGASVIIAILLPLWMIPRFFERTEERLTALGGEDDDIERLRKSVAAAAELTYWLLWFFIVVYVSR